MERRQWSVGNVGSARVESYRSRGGGCSTNGRSRGGTREWRVKTQSTDDAEPHAMQYVSDAEGSNPHSVPDSDAETTTSNLHSIPGDSVVCSDSDMEEQAERKRANAQPKLAFHGDDRSRGESSIYNEEPEVGNIGFFFGNWGTRATLESSRIKRKRSETSDRQIMRCPAQIIILAEATEHVEEVLKSPPLEAEDPGAKGLSGRRSFEHFVVRGNEEDAAVLIAARKDNCTYVELLDYDLNFDHDYREKQKVKQAYTRMLSCKVGFKQNVGHLGKSLNCMGVHGHCRTMKMQWKEVYTAFWDRLADKLKQFDIEIMAGDFNMSLTRVVPELSRRGLQCDCIAWYPWIHKTVKCHDQPLGFDSCGVFFIGGNVQVKLHWDLSHLDILTAVADDLHEDCGLDRYGPGSVPGQPWQCYRSQAHDESVGDKNLQARLTELLTPSTPQEYLDQIPKRSGKFYCPYMRFRQKPLAVQEWLVDGKDLHNGAHFPECVFTHNASARSKDRQEARSARFRASQERNENPQNIRSRGPGASAWNTHNQQHRQLVLNNQLAYVSQCVPAAYVSQGRSWEENSWKRGDVWWAGERW